jgi:hypothetical protein
MKTVGNKMRRVASVALALAATTQGEAVKSSAPLRPREQAASGPMQPANDLENAFRYPRQEARPRVWWHWVNGNVSRTGIDRDLRWMKRIGIGGFQLFDVDYGVGSTISRPIGFMDEHWKRLVGHAAWKAKALGLKMSLAPPGTSEAGGPWIKAERAMKKLVWSETVVQGGTALVQPLAAPPAVCGPFQDMPGLRDSQPAHCDFFRDQVVVAYRRPAVVQSGPVLTASSATGLTTILEDGHFDKAITVGPDKSGKIWLLYDYGREQTIRSLQIAAEQQSFSDPPLPQGVLEASEDGKHFELVRALPPSLVADLGPGTINFKEFFQGYPPVVTLSFAPVKARYFRLTLQPSSSFTFHGRPRKISTKVRLSEANLSALPRPDRFEAQAAFVVNPSTDVLATYENGNAAIDPESVIDVTRHVDSNGVLRWTPPPGAWTILRIGYSLTGITNQAARPQARGFEVDKLSTRDVSYLLNHYFKRLVENRMPLAGIGLDSWEVGQENWTPRLLGIFKARLGYDPTPYLPVLANHVVRDGEHTDRFLSDFRRLLADQLSQSYSKNIAHFAREHGLALYGETPGIGLPTNADGLQMKRPLTVPMSEFWQVPVGQNFSGPMAADLREAASAAHVYGQNVAASESFTALPDMADYSVTPWELKPLADRAMADGTNLFFIHTSVHQPDERRPGISLGPYGQHFNRHETWAEFAGPWIAYLARSSQLLQAGRFAGDIAIFYGETTPVGVPDGGNTNPAVPAGYGYDFISRDALLGMQFREGSYRFPSGMRYRLLVLPKTVRRMSVPVLEKLSELVTAGGALLGAPPSAPASLTDNPARWRELVHHLWRGGRVTHTGAGAVFSDGDIGSAMARLGVKPDVVVNVANGDASEIASLHRITPDTDIYYLVNTAGHEQHITTDLRSARKAVELWHADSGNIEAVERPIRNGDRTILELDLAPYESLFVMLRDRPSRAAIMRVPGVCKAISQLGGPWTLTLPLKPRVVTREPRPVLWSDMRNGDARYFSGIAQYRTTFSLSKEDLRFPPLTFDLGEVHSLARVVLNGRALGILWKPPFRVELGRAARAGQNHLEIDVANGWANRIIGDLIHPTDPPVAFITNRYLPLMATSPLRPSGLAGPVQILTGPCGN